METGRRVRKLRTDNDLNQEELAKIAGCTRQVISNIERGYTGVSSKVLDKLTKYFDVPADYILGITDGAQSNVVTLQDDEERDLLHNYRKMTKRQKRIFLGMMEEVLSSPDPE